MNEFAPRIPQPSSSYLDNRRLSNHHTPYPYAPHSSIGLHATLAQKSSEGISSSFPESSFHSSMLPPKYEQSFPDGDAASEDEEEEEDEDEDGMIESDFVDGKRSQSGDSKDGSGGGGTTGTGSSPKKKPRITLARGGACVACRNRKLKCTGERPCKTCQKANIECRYEEIQRKKPRAVLLEERVAELEALLTMRGEPLPPSQLHTSPKNEHRTSFSMSAAHSQSTTGKLTPSSSQGPVPSNQPPSLSLMSFEGLPSNHASLNTPSRAEIPPGSPLESALIHLVLPHAPFLLMPIHPPRFLALLTLPGGDPQRPHPAFMYILFAEAARILEQDIPAPQPPASPYPSPTPPPAMPPPTTTAERARLAQHVSGLSVPLLERARIELENGIRTVDRPFDLVRAAIGIARFLYAQGRFIEGWNVPVNRLLISCGIHRMTGNIYPPPLSTPPSSYHPDLPPQPAPSHFYPKTTHVPHTGLPILRMRPVIVPPARDDIELAERNLVFWAGKVQDWEAGTGWGWTTSLNDSECTSEWPWGQGGVPEPKNPATANMRYSIRDLYDTGSALHQSPYPDSTYVLAVKSMGLLHRSSHLFDRPEVSVALPTPTGMQPPNHLPPLPLITEVETALRLFRQRIPPAFADPPLPHAPSSSGSGSSTANSPGEAYDGSSDPWWIMLHANLYTAEMMMWKEMAHHQQGAYETAVSCARALVGLVRRLRPENWAHVDMIVALDMSLASRFLFHESERLNKNGQAGAAGMAAEEAEVLRGALERDYARWLPMASLHALIVQRVREGWPEKEGEYERL